MTINRQSKTGDSSPGKAANRPTSRECEEAVALAEAILPTIGKNPLDYELIMAGTLKDRAGVYRGPDFWYLTFKLRRLIPPTPKAKLGKGGEVFVEVDIAQKRAWVTGYGE